LFREEKLRGATLTVAVLVCFVGLVLTLVALLRIVLSGLAALLALSALSGLATLLALSELVALLTYLLHIVCHKKFLLRKHGSSRAF